LGQPLTDILDEVAAGSFPPADGGVTILPQPSARDAGVIGFTAHAVIFIDADPAWVASQLPPGDLSGPLSPAFLQALCLHTGRTGHSQDVLTLAAPLPGPPEIELILLTGPAGTASARAAAEAVATAGAERAAADLIHPRLERASHYRDEISAWQTDGGIVLIGRGVGGRWETAIEVDPERRSAGLGRRLAAAARHLVPGGAPLWAQVAPGNAASLRAFLAAGFVPVGAEALLSTNPE
jgi:GNAT superfamily N-acetyltransferase